MLLYYDRLSLFDEIYNAICLVLFDLAFESINEGIDVKKVSTCLIDLAVRLQISGSSSSSWSSCGAGRSSTTLKKKKTVEPDL